MSDVKRDANDLELDPDAFYEPVNGGFVTTVDGQEFSVPDNKQLFGNSPVVIARAQLFRLTVEDERKRRERAKAKVSPATVPATPRPRGRPKGSRLYEPDALVAEYRRVRLAFGRRPTQDEFCASARPRIETRTLQEYLSEYESPWPIE
jgi:hypothetical protein